MPHETYRVRRVLQGTVGPGVFALDGLDYEAVLRQNPFAFAALGFSSEKVLTPQLWEDLLTDHDFTVEAIDLLHRQASDPVVDQLIQARCA